MKARLASSFVVPRPALLARGLALIALASAPAGVASAQVLMADDDDGQPGQQIMDGPGPETVAAGEASGMGTSRHNLYWTTNATPVPGGPTTATLYVQGFASGAKVRYTATGVGLSYGDVVYRHTEAGYIYFVVNHGDAAAVTASQIVRLPLVAPPPLFNFRFRAPPVRFQNVDEPMVVAASPGVVGTRDLVGDGYRLYWASEAGVHSVPLAGGPVTALVATTAARNLALDDSYVYFTDGLQVRRVAKGGGVATTEVVASAAVTALDVSGGALVWGDATGAVRTRPTIGSFLPVLLQAPAPDTTVTSVLRSPWMTLWSVCHGPELERCAVRLTGPFGPALAIPPSRRIAHLTVDPTSGRQKVAWTDADAVEAFGFPADPPPPTHLPIDVAGAATATFSPVSTP